MTDDIFFDPLARNRADDTYDTTSTRLQETEMSAPALSPSSGDYGAAWQRTQRRLRAELGEDIYLSWFARIELESVDKSGLAHLSVPTRFLRSWIQSHYADRILRAFQAEDADIQRIELSLRTAGGRPAAARPVAAGPPP